MPRTQFTCSVTNRLHAEPWWAHEEQLRLHNVLKVQPESPEAEWAYRAQSWVYDLINVQPVWRQGFSGKGVTIMIGDLGVFDILEFEVYLKSR